MKVRAFKDWLDAKIYENPQILDMELGYIDIGYGAWYTGLVLSIIERTMRDGTTMKQVEIDGP